MSDDRRPIGFRTYQRRAAATDQRPRADDESSSRCDDSFVIPLLGIGGELGTLQAEYKKYLRDGEEYRPFRDHIREELGDVLWYVANLATKFNLDLAEIAAENLVKIEDRWAKHLGMSRVESDLLDAGATRGQKLPHRFAIEFRPIDAPNCPEPIVQRFWRGKPWGDPLGDNAYGDDGYRFHDVFHLAHAAILGWSPVCRRSKQFNCKRSADRTTDAVEDGGRAIVTEEAIVAYIYGHARDHGWFERIDQSTSLCSRQLRASPATLKSAAHRFETESRRSSTAIAYGCRCSATTAGAPGGTSLTSTLDGPAPGA